MSSVTVWTAAYFLHSLWVVPVIAMAAAGATFATKPLGPAASHRVWVGALCGMVLAPALPWLHGSLARAGSRGMAAGRVTVALHLLGSVHDGAPKTVFVLTAGTLRAGCLLFVVALLWAALRLSLSVVRTFRLRRRAIACEVSRTRTELWDEFRGWSGVEVAVCSSDEVSGPVVLGHRRPTLLVPPGLLACVSEQDLRAALAHEAAHLRRHDYLKNLLYELISLPVAFHPVTWWVKVRLAQTREMACDAEAVRDSALGRAYREALLRLALLVGQASQVHHANAIGIFDANNLEERVMELGKGKRKMVAGLRYALSLTAMSCVLLGVAAAASAPRLGPRTDQDSPDAARVYRVGKDATAPGLLKSADPQFPASYRGGKVPFDGTCRLKLIVDRQGLPRDVEVVKSLGKNFDESAVRAVQQYRFRPAMHSGQPVAVALFIDVRFQKF